MIIKKMLVLTSSLLFTATILAQVYSFTQARFQPKAIDLSAFTNLSANVKSFSTTTATEEILAKEDTVITNEIIELIGKEIGKKIKNTRYAINTYKTKQEEVKTRLATSGSIINLEAINEQVSYEINNKELINLYGLTVEQMAFVKFETTKLADIYYKDEIRKEVKDEVVVAQASTESTESAEIQADEVKMIQPAPERKEQVNKPEAVEVVATDEQLAKEDDEMVVFDYSNKSEPVVAKKSIDEKLYERPLSSTVKNAISRELAKSPVSTVETKTKIDNQEIDLESDNNIIYDYSKENKLTNESAIKESEAAINAFVAPAKNDQENFQLSIRAKEINLNTHKLRQASAFEFVPDYERGERVDDQAGGEINLGYSLNGSVNTQTGVIQSKGVITTRVELDLGLKNSIEIPLINEEGMQLFLQKQGLAIEGNLILLAIDSTIVDTEIDSQFAQRFYFNETFKQLTSNAGASYVMYAGVKNGNIMIRYLLSNKESAQKIVYVGEGELYFEDPSFINSKRETYTFTTRNLLGQKKKELIIDGQNVSFFNTNITAKKKALNAYEIKVPTLVTGMRKYLEFKHLKESIFVGTSNEKDIEVPSNDFIAKVLEINDVSSLKERCVVQVNLSKDLRDIKANGKNKSGEMFVETSFLDKDGNFSKDSEMSEKAFIIGDMEGQFGVRLDYTDGSSEFLKTFCSEGTYLVEQL